MYILDLNNPPNSNFDMDLQFCPKHNKKRFKIPKYRKYRTEEKCI